MPKLRQALRPRRRVSVRAIAAVILFGIIGATATLGYVTWAGGERRSDTNDVVEHDIADARRFEEARTSSIAEAASALGYLTLRNPEYLEAFETSAASVDELLDDVRRDSLAGNPEEAAKVGALLESHHRLTDAYGIALAELAAGNDAAAFSAFADGEIATEIGTFLDSLALAAEDAQAELLAAQQTDAATQELWDRVGLGLAAFLVFVGLVSVLVAFQVVVRPVERVAAASGAIAAGDVEARAPEGGPSEIAALGKNVNRMADALIARSKELNVYLSRNLERRTAELERANESLREQARRDSLTDVLNHAAIIEELQTTISSGGGGGPHAVAIVDVDGLKTVNDTFGHQMGDAVLVAVAKALSRDGAIVGRYGGDEFAAILPGADRAAAERYRAGVLERLADQSVSDSDAGTGIPVVASVGVAVYPSEATSISDLIRTSDNAMYESRRQRPVGAGTRLSTRMRGETLASRVVGEIVPLLTAAGDLNDKFRLVAHRLSAGAGYDAVDISLFSDVPGAPIAQNTIAKAPDGLVDAWRERREQDRLHPVRVLMDQSPRPLIIEEPHNDERLLPEQRSIIKAAGLHSVLVAPMTWRNTVIGTIGVASKRAKAFTPHDAEFLLAVATQVTAIVRMDTLVSELETKSARLLDAQTDTVTLLAAAAEAHDRTTGRHLHNIRALVEALARELGYESAEATALGSAAMLHDIGKIRVPESVLSATGTLQPEEWELMQRHTTWGAAFLSGRPDFELAATIAAAHHERWDGSGYPEGITGPDIPQPAAIVAVADSFDAITSNRPYRAGRSVEAAVREIRAGAGRQFSPEIVDALLRLHERGDLSELRAEIKQQAA